MFPHSIRSRELRRETGRRPGYRGRVEWLETRALLATIVVTGTGDSIAKDGVVTLREAILSTNGNADVNSDVTTHRSGAYVAGAAGADAITVPAGNYTLSIAGANENAAATGDLDITDALNLNGAGATTTIIDAGGIDRVIDVIGVVPVSFSGLTIRNGNAGTDFSGGGGVHMAFGSTNTTPYTVKFTDCAITGNLAVNGGGINNDDAQNNSLVLIRTTVANNKATVSDGSSVNDGGGIVQGANGKGSLTLIDCIVRDNVAAREDGGILAAAGESSDLTITGSTISGNVSSKGVGGGIDWSGGTFLLTNSTVSGNTAGDVGGGMVTVGTVTVTNCTISGNKAGTDGGGIASFDGPFTLTNTTITSNVADNNNDGSGNGGGIFNSAGQVLNLRNTILAGNTDRGGQAPDGSGTFTSQGHNLILSTAGLTLTGDTTGNILGKDPKLGLLAKNGGSTLTQLPLAGSPAIDAGTSAGAPAKDQRGITRPQGARVDIGAVEVVPVTKTASADLALAVSAAPSPVSANGNISYTITLKNNGPDAAKGANLSTNVPAGTTFVSLTVPAGWTRTTPAVGSTGAVSTSASQVARGQEIFTLVVHVNPTTPGGSNAVLQVQARASTTDPVAGNNTATATVQVQAAPPPPVGNGPTVTNVQRFGFHMQPTELVLTFSGPLATTAAGDPSSFHVVARGADGRFGTKDDRIIAINSARLDSTGTIVTLAPSRRLALRQPYLLVVNGNSPGGLTDSQDRLLDGDNNGVPGGNFVVTITRDLLAGPVSSAAKAIIRRALSEDWPTVRPIQRSRLAP